MNSDLKHKPQFCPSFHPSIYTIYQHKIDFKFQLCLYNYTLLIKSHLVDDEHKELIDAKNQAANSRRAKVMVKGMNARQYYIQKKKHVTESHLAIFHCAFLRRYSRK